MDPSIAVLVALLLIFAVIGGWLIVAPPPRPRGSRPAAERGVERPLASAPTAPRAAPEVAAVAPRVVEIDPIDVTARRMVRDAHEIARHLGLEAIPDRASPTVYELSLEAQSELERAALERIAAAGLACVIAVTIHRDGRRARARIDVARPPPSA